MREDQFEDAFRTLAPRVYAYARRHIDLAACEDVVAETFLIAWRRLGEVPEQPRRTRGAAAHRVGRIDVCRGRRRPRLQRAAVTVRISRGRARRTQTPRSADHPHATAPSLRLVEDLP